MGRLLLCGAVILLNKTFVRVGVFAQGSVNLRTIHFVHILVKGILSSNTSSIYKYMRSGYERRNMSLEVMEIFSI